MARINNIEDLKNFRETYLRQRQAELEEKPLIYVGCGTCGLAAGAGETLEQIQIELRKRNLEVEIVQVGCIGMCVREPLVDIKLSHQPRITYGNVKPDMVARIIDQHLIGGQPVTEWIVGVVPEDW